MVRTHLSPAESRANFDHVRRPNSAGTGLEHPGHAAVELARRGIGPVYAKKLVRTFGKAVFDPIKQEPGPLRKVTGIGPKCAERGARC